MFPLFNRRLPEPAIVVSVRYSVLLSGTAGSQWRLGQGAASDDDYRAKLFDPDRLRLHHRLFSTVTLPSLLSQVPRLEAKSFRLNVIISDCLPTTHKQALYSTIQGIDWVRVVELPQNASSVPHADLVAQFLEGRRAKGALHAHARLDDDDAVSADFFSNLRRHIRPEHEGWVVSQGFGVTGHHDGAAFTAFETMLYPKIAIGLAYIGGRAIANVHALNNHIHVDRRVPVILDSRKLAFIRTVHDQSDTGAALKHRTAAPDPKELKAAFPFL